MSWSRAVRRSIITALTCAGISIFYSGNNSRQRDWLSKGGAFLERRSRLWWILTNTADQRISCVFGKQPEKSLEMNKVQTCKSAVLCPSLLTVVVHWLNEFHGWWVLWSHFWDFVVAFCVSAIGTKIGYSSPILMWILGMEVTRVMAWPFCSWDPPLRLDQLVTTNTWMRRFCHQHQWKIWHLRSIASESLHMWRRSSVTTHC